ncbi:hypothetical protein AnigIFM60653_006492 [Aspergillus niger]|nr:hypothetical protein AnigIFM50267_006168 [Aspergillus niger]GLA05971.1 hypothetical protein AnigIFM60653_006492 [Aspergillus niger]
MASITFKRRQHYAVFNSLELRQHEHLWKFHKAVRQTNARILTLRIFKLPRSTRKLRSVQQASSDMKKGVVAAQLVGSGNAHPVTPIHFQLLPNNHAMARGFRGVKYSMPYGSTGSNS